MKNNRRNVGSIERAGEHLQIDSATRVRKQSFTNGLAALCTAAFLIFASPLLGDEGAQIPPGWEWLLKIVGISSGAESMHDPIVDVKFSSGEIWIARISDKEKLRVDEEGSYRSPIFQSGGVNVIALKDESVVRFPIIYQKPTLAYELGTPEVLAQIPGIVKLIGYNRDAPEQILFLAKPKEKEVGRKRASEPMMTVGLFSLTERKVQKAAPWGTDSATRDAYLWPGHLHWWTRVYGDLYVDVSFSSEQGMDPETSPVDVFVGNYSDGRTTSKKANISQCGGDICGQPSLSDDRNHVAFIRQRR